MRSPSGPRGAGGGSACRPALSEAAAAHGLHLYSWDLSLKEHETALLHGNWVLVADSAQHFQKQFAH